MLVKTGIQGLVRDTKTGMLINTNTKDYAVHKAQAQVALQNKDLHAKVATLENDISEIKSLLLKILEK